MSKKNWPGHKKPVHNRNKRTCSKRQFRTAKEAYEMLRVLSLEMVVYQCPYCKPTCYHLGHKE